MQVPASWFICSDCKQLFNQEDQFQRKNHYGHQETDLQDFIETVKKNNVYKDVIEVNNQLFEGQGEQLRRFFSRSVNCWISEFYKKDLRPKISEAYQFLIKKNIKELKKKQTIETLIDYKDNAQIRQKIHEPFENLQKELKILGQIQRKYSDGFSFIQFLLTFNNPFGQIPQMLAKGKQVEKKSFQQEFDETFDSLQQFLTQTSFYKDLSKNQNAPIDELFEEIKAKESLSELMINFNGSNFNQLDELCKVLAPFDTIQKMYLDLSYPCDKNLNLQDITPLAKIIGKLTRLEWLQLRFGQYCDVPHLENIDELGIQLENLVNLKFFHIYIEYIYYIQIIPFQSSVSQFNILLQYKFPL